ncbi:MAG: isochorismatase family protein [Actinomycetota bacterium]|nr:isochorismatase family protein [Actinomycetota bacterium]
MSDRPADVVSPTADQVLATKVSVADARAAGRVGYDKPTPQNSVMLLVDHQIGLMVGARDFPSLATYKANVVALAQMAKALEIPVLISSSNAQWQNGDTMPELKEIFSDLPIHRRTGIINCYEDPTFRSAFDDLLASTGRTHVIIAGVTIGTCCALPTLSMRNDGYQVFPVVDACGAWDDYEAQAAIARMSRAGAEPVTVFALGCELQADWKLPSGNDMLSPFTNQLPEYGWVVQNFWNNANQHAVPDPFGMVK